MSDRWIVPVQLRGIGARSVTQEERRAVPVRIRTRGRLERALDMRDNGRELVTLATGLRSEVEDLPLTALVVWRSDAGAGEILPSLTNVLTDPYDAIWIGAVDNVSDARSAVSGAGVVLDLISNERDRRICANLVVDLLFIAADEPDDADLLGQFGHRASLAIIPYDAKYLGRCGDASTAAGIPVLSWHRTSGNVTSPLPAAFFGMFLRADESDNAWAAASARRLAQIAVQLTSRSDRRIRFRALLKEAAAQNGGDDWYGRMIALAHEARWPGWAVETLPRRFVRIGTNGDHVRALTWSLFVDCIAVPVTIREQLCGGVLFEISIREEFCELLSEIDREIDAIVDQQDFQGDGPFFSSVARALEKVAERARKEPFNDVRSAERMSSVSGRLASRRG